MIISLLKSPQDDGLVHRLEAFGFGFFIPVFFIMVGTTLDLQSLFESPQNLLLLPVLLLLSLVIKGLPVLLLKRNYSWREILAGGALLNTHLSLEIAIAVIAIRVGLMDTAANATVILFAILSVVAMPLFFGALLPATESESQRFKLIAGVNETSLKVAQELRAHGDQVYFTEENPELAGQVSQSGFQIYQQGTPEQAFEKLDTSQVEAFLALSQESQVNLNLARLARERGIRNIVAYVVDPDLLPEFNALDVQAYSPAVKRATLISMMARSPDALNLLSSHEDQNDTVEINLMNGSLVQKPIRALNLPGNCLVLAIRRGEELLVPRGNTEMMYGDRITLFGPKECLADIKRWLESRYGRRPKFIR
jgi:CPA2 family monovalent cation:H+ antiporter-2